MDIKRDLDTGTVIQAKIRRPSNLHAHFRRDALMRAVAVPQMRGYKYVLAMPNTGPIVSIEQAEEYYRELAHIAQVAGLTKLSGILMTLYHTAAITPAVIEEIARWNGPVRAVKHYPHVHGATTGSGAGIPLEENPDMLRAMEETGVPLLGHFEDVHDLQGRELPHAQREEHCIEHRLWRLRDKYPNLRICFEHCSTRKGVEFIKADESGRTAGTFTPQHHWFTAADFEKYSWRNHLRCMPYVKTEDDREAVVEFTTSGDFRAIAGDDTAPHPSKKKNIPFEEAACGCYLPHAVALYITKFIERNALSQYEKFASLNGPRWWGLPEPDEDDLVTIRQETAHDIPDPTPIYEEDDVVIPLGWSTEDDRLKIGYALAS